MSTVAYRDGIMACDTRAYTGSRTPIGTKVKTARLLDRTLVGISTTRPGGGERFLRWISQVWGTNDFFDGRENFPGLDSFTGLVVKATGEAYLFEDRLYPSGPIEGKFFAIGSGAEFALGAMESGRPAVEAAQIAAKLDPWSQAPIVARSHTIVEPWQVL